MAGEKVKLSRAESLDLREANLLKQLEEIRQRRAILKVTGEERRLIDQKKYVLGGELLLGVAAGEKVALNALEWAKARLKEPRHKKLFGVALTDAERTALEAAERRRATRSAPASRDSGD